ncbi:hypothetical protein fugu_005268 [Takifugu bimaculatus]|uniref:Tubulin monoglycylase TTLL3-like n=1 Tax=Takifugu bimaculatus TaxID=433685 RepID=A0A4Z2B999_9TELE|nr:hypothetical protein fugu_005268 [Takifugu bimaculatus]
MQPVSEGPITDEEVPAVKGRSRSSMPRLPPINAERMRMAKALVEKAVKLKKVFTVVGPYPVIRQELRARGWVERPLSSTAQKAHRCHGNEMDCGDDEGLRAERDDGAVKVEKIDDMQALMSRMVRKETTHFFWTSRRDEIDCRLLQHDQIINHYANAAAFATKVGLCLNLRNLRWFDAADPDTFFPRCYRLGAADEKQAFIEDFRRTACTSLLQHVVELSSYSRAGAKEEELRLSEDLCEHKHQFISAGVIDAALRVCQQYLSVLEHCDIDITIEMPRDVNWGAFLQDYYKVVHDGVSIRGGGVFVERCQAMLRKLWEVCPQLGTDGLNNIWIIKPGAMSRGRGIMCKDRLDEILAVVDNDKSLNKERKWVVQKYLERPLLIHGTKFDLRQWFLVTDWNPLTVWFYKECYLRFSTQPFSTKILDSSVHLCNNSIQKHFEPARDRHPLVPEDNMWSCSQFRAFLHQQGRSAEWDSVTVPGMQKAIIRALQTAQEQVEPRKGSFELYGADFMLGRDLRPWLLEINVCPTMAQSTGVTAHLCPAVQIDTLKVVLDRRTDANAHTGGFQLICKQVPVEVPYSLGVNLAVEGAPLRPPRACRQTALTNLPHSDLTSQQLKEEHRSSSLESYKVSDSCQSGKKRKSKKKRGNKKRQMASTSPEKGPEQRGGDHKASCAGRSLRCTVYGQSSGESKRISQCLGLHDSKTALIPLNLSFSLSPHHSTLPSQRPLGQRSHISGSIPLPTPIQHHNRMSAPLHPRLRLPLPSLEVLPYHLM